MALRQELRLVDEDAVELALAQLVADRVEQVDALVIGVGGRGQSYARAYGAIAGSVVKRRSPQHRFHAALAIVEVGLEQGRRFPRVHRRIVEVELGHLLPLYPCRGRGPVQEKSLGSCLRRSTI